METASSPILNTLRFRGGAAATSTSAANTAKLYYHIHNKRPCGSSLLASPGNCLYYRGRFQKKLRFDRLICEASSLNSAESDQSHKFAVLIEVEGCVCFVAIFLILFFVLVRFVLRFLNARLDEFSEEFSAFPYFCYRVYIGAVYPAWRIEVILSSAFCYCLCIY